MNKKITLSIAAMLMISSQVHADLSANSTTGANIASSSHSLSPAAASVANAYIPTMPSFTSSQLAQQLPVAEMAFTATGPTITPSGTLTDSGINTNALYENMAMAQNVGATHNSALNLMSGNTNTAMSDSSTHTSTLTDSSNNTYTNSANTATSEGSGSATNDSEPTA